MSISFMQIILIGFILGLKHALEPDHLIAVSTIASKSKSIWRSSLAGMFWGIGHTSTIFIIGIVFIAIKGEVPTILAKSLEFIVGLMLVYLGISNIYTYRKNKIHVHTHEHNNEAHTHFHLKEETHEHQSNELKASYMKSLFIGFIHGLAGSAAMIILTISTVSSLLEGALYIVIFGIGTTLSMLLFTTIIGLPFALSTQKTMINKSLSLFAGIISVSFGVYYMYNLGITEGLFKLWLQ